jgi:hypothetical protein
MDEFSTPSDTLDQIDEEVLSCTASDEALEAAAVGTLGGSPPVLAYQWTLVPPGSDYNALCMFHRTMPAMAECTHAPRAATGKRRTTGEQPRAFSVFTFSL